VIQYGAGWFMRILNAVLALSNVALLCVILYFATNSTIHLPKIEMEYKDFISIMLTATTVILAAVTIFIGGVAIWGYNSIQKSAVDEAVRAAQMRAKEVAEAIAREVAGPVAAREARAALPLASGDLDVTQRDEDALTDSLSSRLSGPPND
jgi:hypothetical protein